MPDLNFEVERALPLLHSVAPQLVFKLRITDLSGADATWIPAVALRCQIRIEPTRRRYAAAEQDGLLDLFGDPSRWGQTLRSLLWAQVEVNVPPFQGTTLVDLRVPCSYDFNVAVTKYFYSLEDGEVPTCLLFSGTIFSAEEEGGPLHVSPISWEKETSFRLPVQVWKEMMDLYYPNSAWLCLQRDVFDQLYRYKIRRGLPTWEQALECLMSAAGGERGQS
jgi:hypothetical protein